MVNSTQRLIKAELLKELIAKIYQKAQEKRGQGTNYPRTLITACEALGWVEASAWVIIEIERLLKPPAPPEQTRH